MNALPLSNVRVVDFTWIGAGSYATKILADFGADVIKVESRGRLDSLRDAKPFKDGIAGVNRSGYFADRNSSKRSITVDLKQEAGRALVRRLIADCDVVTNNFTPGVMERFGLGYEDVRRIRPDVVYLAMSMQGQDGPEAHYLGYGLTMGAVTGLQYLCGLPDEQPAGTGTNFPDHVPNPTHAAVAVLAALRHRARTGEGQFIDLAQIEPTVALLGPAVADWTVNRVLADRVGNQHIDAAPHGVYPVAGEDRWIAISAPDAGSWSGLCEVLGAPEWIADPRFAQADARWRHRAALDAAVAQRTAGHDGATLMHALQRAGVAAGVVQDAADVLQDPQLQARVHWVYLAHPEMGRTVYGALPIGFSGFSGKPNRPAPLLGQHTEEVLAEKLGLSVDEIADLQGRGVLS
ncbi:CoA transferase [Xylophilus sp. Kf1]|nr:CoA transferase [Xylophilus sp. Kf1]